MTRICLFVPEYFEPFEYIYIIVFEFRCCFLVYLNSNPEFLNLVLELENRSAIYLSSHQFNIFT